MSLVTPLDQKSPNFLDGLQILKRFRQEKGTPAEKPKTSNDASGPLPPTEGLPWTLPVPSARYVWGRRDRGHKTQMLPLTPYRPGEVGRYPGTVDVARSPRVIVGRTRAGGSSRHYQCALSLGTSRSRLYAPNPTIAKFCIP